MQNICHYVIKQVHTKLRYIHTCHCSVKPEEMALKSGPRLVAKSRDTKRRLALTLTSTTSVTESILTTVSDRGEWGEEREREEEREKSEVSDVH